MNNPRAVIFLSHPYHRGGVTSWMINAAIQFALRGTKIYFITVSPEKPFISRGTNATMVELVKGFNKNIEVIAPRVGYEFELGTEDYKSCVYTKAVTSVAPFGTPIIVSNDPAVWQAAAMISDHYPMIGVLHGDDVPYYKLAEKYASYLSYCVSVSNRIASRIKSVINNSAVIPCGIEVQSYYRKATSYKREKLEIIWLGRLEEEAKRVSDIALVAEVLKQRNLDFRIRVIGMGPEVHLIEKAISEKHLEKEVILLGWQSKENIITLLHESEILLQTSNFEGMSVAVMEGLAAGCAIVSTKVSGVEDYENNAAVANCLFLFPTGEVNLAADAIITAMSLPYEKRSAEAQRFATNEFSIESCIDRYSIIIENCKPSPVAKKLSSKTGVYIQSFLIATIRRAKYNLSQFLKKKRHS